MRRTLLSNLSLCTRNRLLSPQTFNPNPTPSLVPLARSTRSLLSRFFSSDGDSSAEGPNPAADSSLIPTKKKDASVEVKDVNNKAKNDVDLKFSFVGFLELKERIDKYFKGDEEALPEILEAILQRRLAGKHEETDDELIDELQMQPLDDVKDQEFESDFEELYDTDEEIDDLYNAKDIVMNRMSKDEYFNMDAKKWDDIVEDAIKHGIMKDTKECEAILEDMLSWDKLLPDDMKRKVEEKFNDLGDKCERGELQPEEAYELFKEFEDEIVMDYLQKMEADGPPQFDEDVSDKKDLADPPGEGPILRWQTRVVFAPGGDSWHPKNRKVKLSVTVKELGLSKHQFRRLRDLVGKRYNPGKDELTITSERFEHREENRKDCLRTLLSLIEEAGKANKLAEDARVSYVKERLRANPAFMERLHNKTMRLQGKSAVPA
ncbi:hypothetical protein C1H46_023810 [Malus baccata]|uniref:Small ribosomal subunit protein mS35 mitochondrial conserved domain-containing protein n=1 Tax=Malus baccata TaxID=106549 RepID=A0A540LVX8_MALBA|nr:hypothetical protein C1H46_023810 [Malus baccata]